MFTVDVKQQCNNAGFLSVSNNSYEWFLYRKIYSVMCFPHFLSLHVVMNMHGSSLDCVTLHCTYSYHPTLSQANSNRCTCTQLFWYSFHLYIRWFVYKIRIFFFQNRSKNLDPSYKMDLDFWGCLGRDNLALQQNCT